MKKRLGLAMVALIALVAACVYLLPDVQPAYAANGGDSNDSAVVQLGKTVQVGELLGLSNL